MSICAAIPRTGLAFQICLDFGRFFTPSHRISRPLIDMEASALQCVYPLHRCKTIHLVRHGQGFHNVAGEAEHKAYLSEEFFDANLTPLGWEQVANLRKHIHASGLASKIELVITSPLLRTLQTAVGVFGGKGYLDGTGSPPLMISNAGNSDQEAISSCGHVRKRRLLSYPTVASWCTP